ncbi:hypothetical protein GF407_19190 [candidate division KSB1 bacterium]|nr:hypothetical protein [candidate division KSB1 bacterium]
MKRFFLFSIVFMLFFVFVFQLQADVKKESVTQLEFKGTLGMMMKVMGASKPTYTIEYYKGDMFKTETLNKKEKLLQAQIIDLDNELIYSIDHENEQYTEMTFDEWRQLLETQMQQVEDESPEQDVEEGDTKVEWQFDVDVKKPGKTETVAGKKSEKAVITLNLKATATEKESEEGPEKRSEGELIVTSTHWLAKELEGREEINAFRKKLVEKLGFEPSEGGMREVFGRIAQSHPQLAEAMKKLQEESAKLEGVSMKSHTLYATKGSEMGKEEEKEEEKIPTSVGGFMKGLGKKVAESRQSDDEEKILIESTSETTAYTLTTIDAAEFNIPDSYKKK